MYGFAVAEDHSGAAKFLAAMEAGSFDVKPGSSCYGGFILSCIRCHAWQDSLSAYETMKLNSIVANAIMNHGLILSAYHHGDRPRVELILEDILDHGGNMNKESCILVLSIVLPSIGAETCLSLRNLQRRVRDFGSDGEETVKKYALDLSRAIKIAELEEQRPTPERKGVQEAWTSVLESTLSLARAAQE
jgi:hypothetical protein